MFRRWGRDAASQDAQLSCASPPYAASQQASFEVGSRQYRSWAYRQQILLIRKQFTSGLERCRMVPWCGWPLDQTRRAFGSLGSGRDESPVGVSRCSNEIV